MPYTEGNAVGGERPMRHIICWIGCLLLLSACDSNKAPKIEYDYKGSFYTESGGCKSSANMSALLNGNRVEIAFYCFIRACVKGSANISQGGYFEADMGGQEFIRGRLSPDGIAGTWQLAINNRKCRGRFEGERIQHY